MHERLEESEGNKSLAAANSISQKSNTNKANDFIDNRPEGIVQRKLQNVIANSSSNNGVIQLKKWTWNAKLGEWETNSASATDKEPDGAPQVNGEFDGQTYDDEKSSYSENPNGYQLNNAAQHDDPPLLDDDDPRLNRKDDPPLLDDDDPRPKRKYESKAGLSANQEVQKLKERDTSGLTLEGQLKHAQREYSARFREDQKFNKKNPGRIEGGTGKSHAHETTSKADAVHRLDKAVREQGIKADTSRRQEEAMEEQKDEIEAQKEAMAKAVAAQKLKEQQQQNQKNQKKQGKKK